jgi:hypothetical protein
MKISFSIYVTPSGRANIDLRSRIDINFVDVTMDASCKISKLKHKYNILDI